MCTLEDMFPLYNKEQLEFIYELNGKKISSTMDCLLDGINAECICSLLARSVFTSEDIGHIRVNSNEEDWVEAALCHYKRKDFDPSAKLRVTITNEPAVDTGGVRRQFFSVAFRQLAYPSLSTSRCIFEGSPFRLRPAYRASNLSSGVLKIVGMMIAHSLLLDGQGFPYLSVIIWLTAQI